MGKTKLELALLSLRVCVLIPMLVWCADKFINPEHTAAVFQNFYFISGINSSISYAIGSLQTTLVLAFGLGIFKTFTYGSVLFMHMVSTLSSFAIYLKPFDGPNILFFAAWPMLGAILTLFLLRDQDTITL